MLGLHDVLDLLPGQSLTAFCGADCWLSCGGAQVQSIIRLVSVPVVTASLTSLATNMRSFALYCGGLMWLTSGVGLVAPLFDVIEAILTKSCRNLAWVWCFLFLTSRVQLQVALQILRNHGLNCLHLISSATSTSPTSAIFLLYRATIPSHVCRAAPRSSILTHCGAKIARSRLRRHQ